MKTIFLIVVYLLSVGLSSVVFAAVLKAIADYKKQYPDDPANYEEYPEDTDLFL